MVKWVLIGVGTLVVAAAVVGAAWFVLTREPGPVTIAGFATVPEAGVLLVDGHWVLLDGVRVPLRDADCGGGGSAIQCTLASAARLAELVAGQHVECETHHKEGDDRAWGVCEASLPAEEGAEGGGHDADPEAEVELAADAPEHEEEELGPVNAQLVRSGWAFADPATGENGYAVEAEEAEHEGLGLWGLGVHPAEVRMPETLAGFVTPVSAIAVDILGVRLHLAGISAPERVQTCERDERVYACGELAYSVLVGLTAGRRLYCEIESEALSGRLYGRCADPRPGGPGFADGASPLGVLMVRAGWGAAAVGIRRMLLAATIAALAVPALAQEVIEGEVEVRGGRVIAVGSREVHLLGLLAFDAFEICLGPDDAPVQCGLIAMGKLVELSAGKQFRCEVETFPGDARLWGICGEAGANPVVSLRVSNNLNRQWVGGGWAFAESQYSQEFVGDARSAAAAGRGLWGVRRTAPAQVLSPFTGDATVRSANAVEIGGLVIGLYGIDAPDGEQTCQRNQHVFACGVVAEGALIRKIIGHPLTCELKRVPADERIYGICSVPDDAASLNAQMVNEGWALANPDHTIQFVPLEESAQASRVGLWQYEFVTPSEWRQGRR